MSDEHQDEWELENAEIIVTLWSLDNSLERMRQMLASINEQLDELNGNPPTDN